MNRVPKFRSGWDQISRWLRLDVNQANTKSSMTHVLVLSGEEWAVMAKLNDMTLVVYLGQLLGFKTSQYFQFKELIYWKFCNPLDFHLPTWQKFALLYISPNLIEKLLSDWVWVPLLQFPLEGQIERKTYDSLNYYIFKWSLRLTFNGGMHGAFQHNMCINNTWFCNNSNNF